MTNDPREVGSTYEDFVTDLTFVPYTHPEAPAMTVAEQRAWNDDASGGLQTPTQGASENLTRTENSFGGMNII